MFNRGLFSTISLFLLLKNINCDKIECPRAEFITTGVDLNEISGEWHTRQALKLEGKPQNTVESEDCVAINIGNLDDGKMKFSFHTQQLNRSAGTESKVVDFSTFLIITQSEGGFKAEVNTNFTDDASQDEDEPDFYVYIMSVEAEKYLILMICEMVGNSTSVNSATIFTRRLGDSKPAINDKELVSLIDLVAEKTQAQVQKRLNFNIDCFSNERNYHW